jgi:hypothetical protein
MAAAGRAGDCGGDDNVTVDELLTMVNIAPDSAAHPLSGRRHWRRRLNTVDDLFGR